MAIRNWPGILLHPPGMLLNPKHILVSSHFFSFIIPVLSFIYHFLPAPRFTFKSEPTDGRRAGTAQHTGTVQDETRARAAATAQPDTYLTSRVRRGGYRIIAVVAWPTLVHPHAAAQTPTRRATISSHDTAHTSQSHTHAHTPCRHTRQTHRRCRVTGTHRSNTAGQFWIQCTRLPTLTVPVPCPRRAAREHDPGSYLDHARANSFNCKNGSSFHSMRSVCARVARIC
jgi:hypothetical protein